MQGFIHKLFISFSLVLLSCTALADSFTLSSTDISHGDFMKSEQEFQGFGCSGGNLSPQLSWTGAPKGTKAFAITAYDPDAPTGSGWWHWQIVNIPSNVSTLATGAGDSSKKLAPSYQFTVHALSTKLELPENASGALAGYMINANSLASSTIEALYKR